MLIKRKTQSSDTDDSSIVRTMKTLTLHFPDMCCPVEFGPVEHALAALSSDIRAVPDYSVRRVKINVPDRSPLEKNAILAAVSKTGQSFDVAASSGWSDDPSFDRVRITVPEMDCPVEAGEIERELKKAGITDYQALWKPKLPRAQPKGRRFFLFRKWTARLRRAKSNANSMPPASRAMKSTS